jgi:hypothetical protein
MSFDNIIGIDEDLPVTRHMRHNEYADTFLPLSILGRLLLSQNDISAFIFAIDPGPMFASQLYQGKVVLVTGASRGIGQETAIQYARAGASLALVARGVPRGDKGLDRLRRNGH